LAGFLRKCAPPLDALVLARDADGEALGCVELRPLRITEVCEMKAYPNSHGPSSRLGRKVNRPAGEATGVALVIGTVVLSSIYNGLVGRRSGLKYVARHGLVSTTKFAGLAGGHNFPMGSVEQLLRPSSKFPRDNCGGPDFFARANAAHTFEGPAVSQHITYSCEPKDGDSGRGND
jgi:hypothetical protein